MPVVQLATAFDTQDRLGRFETASNGFVLPVGATRAIITMPRPNTLIGETPWPDRGPGGVPDNHKENNGRVEFDIGGLDTEILRVYLFLSQDAGSSWDCAGHMGAMGGDLRDPFGLPYDDTLWSQLKNPDNPDRRLQVVLRCRETMRIGMNISLDDLPIVQPIVTHRSLANEDVQSGTSTGSSVSTATLTPANLRRYLTTYAGCRQPSPPATSDCTFGAQSLDEKIADTDVENQRCHAREYVNPSTTGAVVTHTWASTPTGGTVLVACAWSDVDQTTPSDTAVTNTGSGNSPSLTVNAGDAVDVRFAGCSGGISQTDSPTIASDGGQTQLAEIEDFGLGNNTISVDYKAAGESDNIFNWTVSGAAGTFYWVAGGWNINEDTGAAPAAGPKVLAPAYQGMSMRRYVKIVGR